ncbi:MAG: calcium-binding protein [Hyphomicrobiaceae bacterium]
MAVYTHFEVAVPGGQFWFDLKVAFDPDGPGGLEPVISSSPGLVVLRNSDGTETRLFSASNNFVYDPVTDTLTGTITSATRTSSGGGTVYEQITGATVNAFDAYELAKANNTWDAANLVFNGNDTLNGWSGDDNFGGSQGSDTLNGGDGNDTLRGGSGGDQLNGGNGSDWADYSGADNNPVTANLANPLVNTGQAQNDQYSSIENLAGTRFGDTLIGNTEDNWIAGGQGNDTLDGGAGNDTADYFNDRHYVAGTGVTVSLAVAGAQNTGGAGTDDLANFENLRGTAFADSLTGSGIANVLSGEGGNDSLVGGVGNDTLLGGSGNDNMVGNQDNDSIVGGAGDDYAHGGAGNDTLIGEDGNDRLDGGAGNDSIDGGIGADILISNQGDDLIIGGADGDYMHGGQNNDTLQGGDGNDVLLGGVGSDSIDGGIGFDGAAWTGLSSAYTITNNGGGSWTVLHIATGDTDTVTGVEFLVFDDQVVS